MKTKDGCGSNYCTYKTQEGRDIWGGGGRHLGDESWKTGVSGMMTEQQLRMKMRTDPRNRVESKHKEWEHKT